MGRIQSKINEIKSLSEVQMLEYIQNQRDRAIISVNTHQIMRQATPPQPNSPRHTVSEEEWHTQQQLNLNEELDDRLDEELEDELKDVFEYLDEPVFTQALNEGLFSIDDLRGFDGVEMSELLQSASLEALKKGAISLTDIRDPTWRRFFLDESIIKVIEENLVTVEEIKRLEPSAVLTFFHTEPFVALLRDNIITIEEMQGINDTIAFYICELESMEPFRDKLFTLDDLKIIGENNIREFLYPESLQALREGIYCVNDLKEMEDEDAIGAFLHKEVFSAIREERVTLEQLKELDSASISNGIRTGKFEPVDYYELFRPR